MRGPVAQLVEQLTFNQWVTGSNPVGLTIFIFVMKLRRPLPSGPLKPCVKMGVVMASPPRSVV